jgi:hypothetical protein
MDQTYNFARLRGGKRLVVSQFLTLCVDGLFDL